MLKGSIERKFSINLQNGYLAIFIESNPNEISIYIYDESIDDYILNVLKPISSLESCILIALLSNTGHIVSNNILQKSGIGNKPITSNNLRQLILSLRSLLMDCGKPHRVIKNKPRIGYGIYNVDIFYEEVDIYLDRLKKLDRETESTIIEADKRTFDFSPYKKKPIIFDKMYLVYSKITSKAVSLLSFLFFCIIIWMVSNHNRAADEWSNFSLTTHSESIINKKLKVIAFHRGNKNTEYIQMIKSSFMKYLTSMSEDKFIKIMIFSTHDSMLLSCIYDQERFLFKHFQLTNKTFSSLSSVDEIARQCIHISSQQPIMNNPNL